MAPSGEAYLLPPSFLMVAMGRNLEELSSSVVASGQQGPWSCGRATGMLGDLGSVGRMLRVAEGFRTMQGLWSWEGL